MLEEAYIHTILLIKEMKFYKGRVLGLMNGHTFLEMIALLKLLVGEDGY